MTVRAVYTGGVLRPVQPLALTAGETVDATIAPAPTPEEEMIHRIHGCRTYQKWLEVTKELPPDDGGYDIVQAPDENRRWSGERALLPDAERRPCVTPSSWMPLPWASSATRAIRRRRGLVDNGLVTCYW